jgi:hypothetical protein
MRVAETGGSECRPVMGRIEVASFFTDHITSAGNGADFPLVLERETSSGTDEGSKANDGGANRWCSFPSLPRVFPEQSESAATQYRVGHVCFLNMTASSFSEGGVLECSSRMTENFHVRFLEGWRPVMASGYSAKRARGRS